MTATNHSLTGAVIGLVVANPIIAVALSFMSHFACDALPHFGASEKEVNARNRSRLFRSVTLIDVVLVVLLYLYFYTSGFEYIVILCALIAASPDLEWLYRGIRELKTGVETIGNKLTQFHRNIQWSETPKGLGVEFLYGLAVLFILFSVR